MSASPSLRGVSQVALAATSWGTWSLFLRPTGLPGAATAPIILSVLGLSALAIVRAEGAPARWDRRTVGLLLAYAVADAINVGTFFAAMQVTTVAVAVLTHCTAPLLVALLAPRVDGVRVKGSVVAALVALGGLTLLLRPWDRADEGAWLGAALGFTSALAYAALVFLVQPLAARVGVGRATSYHALLAALLLLPFAAPHLGAIEPRHLGLLVLGGLLPGAVSAWLFVDGLRRIGSARAAVLSLLEPTVAVLVGWLAWGEPLAPLAALGGAMVLGGALWVARGERVPMARREQLPPPA
jgi:drug/metabolite transporter, DME family